MCFSKTVNISVSACSLISGMYTADKLLRSVRYLVGAPVKHSINNRKHYNTNRIMFIVFTIKTSNYSSNEGNIGKLGK